MELLTNAKTFLDGVDYSPIKQHMDMPVLAEKLEINTMFSQLSVWDDLFYLIPVYIVLEFLLERFYRDSNGNPVASKLPIWKPLMVVYNIAMTLFSFYCFVGMVNYILNNKLYTNECDTAINNPTFNNLLYLFYVSKYVEFADTVFLIVKGKKVSYLHYIHHIGAALDVGFIYLADFEAGWIFVAFNGFIHTVMYFYYTCALLKIRLPGKSAITSMQIIQFLVGFKTVWHYKDVPCAAQDVNKMWAWVYNYVYVGIVLGLFINFYIQTYVLKSQKKNKKLKSN